VRPIREFVGEIAENAPAHRSSPEQDRENGTRKAGR
jgi:hypothetical protein